MMKNNKLGKLLSVGVASALMITCFAPLAFAEESSVQDNADAYLRVYVEMEDKDSQNVTALDKPEDWSTFNSTSGGKAYYYDFAGNETGKDESGDPVYTFVGDVNIAEMIKDGYTLKEWVPVESYSKWKDGSHALEGVPQTAGTVSVQTLSQYSADDTAVEGAHGSKPGFKVHVLVNATQKQAATVTLTYPGTPTYGDGEKKIKESAALKVDDTEKTCTTNGTYNSFTIYDGQVVTLPKYVYTPVTDSTATDSKVNYAFDKFEVKANVSFGGKTDTVELKGLGMGDTFKLSDFDFTSFKTKYNVKDTDTLTVTIAVAPSFIETTPKLVSLTVDKANLVTVKIGEDGKETTTGVAPVNAANITGIDDKNIGLWNKEVTDKVLAYGETLTLPEVKVTKTSGDKTVDDTKYTFLGWRVETNDTNVLADGTTKAAGFEIANNVFDPTAFKATQDADETVITVVPVFEYKAAASTDVYTAVPAVKTPNDTGLKIYKNGKLVETNKTAEQYYEAVYGEAFKGGAFYNEKDEVFELYKTEKNFNGKWEKDTTATGIADGIYFENGVQDTKAYGLKKVVGDDSAFVYLVSDGVYQADYQGLWISEDKVWYKLDDGCCQGPANGVFKHTNGWYYNFKDGKMVETNGFELYGEDQYWFDAGECNTTGGARVAEHVDGFFYYVNNGIWDNTFNGELDGHTFVNGFAAE